MNNKLVVFIFLFFSFILSYTLAGDELTIEVNSYQIMGETPIDKDDIEALLQPFTGKSVSLLTIQEAATVLQNELRTTGYGFYQVHLAPQTLDNKKIKLSVNPLRINEIYVNLDQDQEHFFSKDNILRSVPALKKGESPNLTHIAQQVELGNLNLSKEINIQFSVNGNSDNQIDADIVVNARKPETYFGWLDNTGTDDTGDFRLGLGYKNLNLFDRDHELSLTYTTSPDHLKEVKQYGVSYRIPFYRYQGVWQLYGYYSDVDSGTVAGGFDVSGQGTFLGTKYEWYLPRLADKKKYTHHLVFGLDDKLFNNDVFFAQEPLGTDVRATPVSLAYKGRWKDLSYSLDYYIQYDHNLEIGSYNDDLHYALSRYQAKPNWDSLKIGLTHNWLRKGYRLATQIDAQLSDQELISGEQFGLGGIGGKLRGFEEREVSGDSGIKGSIELWSPALWKNQINLLAFIDTGYVTRINPLPNETKSDSLASTGIGMIWRWKQYIDFTTTLAHVLDGNDSLVTENPTESGDTSIQFTLYMNY